MTGALLIGTVAGVGVLHTLVPDHWAPIVIIARQRRWSAMQTARAAAIAGLGHVLSTLALGAIVWVAGATVAARYGHIVSLVAAIALVGFGLWIAYGGWKEARQVDAIATHAERSGSAKVLAGGTPLLLILGSSPMIEGIPAFLAASTYGVALLVVMALVFGASTIATYVATSVTGAASLARSSFGPFEKYGELLSGALVAIVGAYAFFTA
jgi:hypothetical protein